VQLVELQGRLQELKAKGFGVASISYDPPHILADFAGRRAITFPLLSDPDSKTIKAYGVLNTTIVPTDGFDDKITMYGVPFPGTLILDRKGVVTARHFEQLYQERATVGTMFLKLGGLRGAGAVQHTTDQLEITTYTTDEIASFGTVFGIVLDIKPREGIHVYAPGVTDYRPISLRLDPIPGLKVRPMQFPASEIYHFVPLNERVPVYTKPFQIVQEVNVETSPAGQQLIATGKLTITGTLEYQACNDKVCFMPGRVPLSWTVNLAKTDNDRPTVER
jgi:peroxiredoxin